MKGKILKTVSVLTLSTFLAVTSVICPVKAAGSYYSDCNECHHANITETLVRTYYPNASYTSHQVAEVYNRYCNDCKKDIGQTTRLRSESHSVGANLKCSKCGYDVH